MPVLLLIGYEDPLLMDVAKLVKTFHVNLPIKVDGHWGFFYKVSLIKNQ